MISEVLFSVNSQTIFIATFVLSLLLYLVWTKRNLPPGPYGLPIIGSMLMMAKRRNTEVFKELRQKYGDVFSIQLGQKLVVVLNGYDALRDAFVKNAEEFSDRPDLYVLSVANGDFQGILTSSGDFWKKTRTFALGALRDFGFGKKSLESKIKEEVSVFLQVLANNKGKEYDIGNILHASVSNIICSIVFGERFEHDDTRFQRLMYLMDENLRAAGSTNISQIMPIVRFLPGDLFKIHSIIANLNEIKAFNSETMENHKISFDSNCIRDFIDVFLQEQQINYSKGKRDPIFDDRNLNTTILQLFVAGTETTTTTISWSIAYMLHHPDVQDKLFREIEEVIGTARSPCLADQQDMTYFRAVLTEVFRISNIVPLSLPHAVSKDVHFRGYTIPKGTTIIPNLESVMRDPELFKNPEEFDPSRFIGSDGKLTGEQYVVAFSLGRRVCLGEALARNELFLFLTSLIQRFQLLPEDPMKLPSLDGVDGITFRPRPFKFRAVERT